MTAVTSETGIDARRAAALTDVAHPVEQTKRADPPARTAREGVEWLDRHSVRIPATPLFDVCKRGLDITLCSLAMVVLLPLMAAIAITIAVASPGAPPLFSQIRAGRGGRTFRVYKFRTMVPNAEELKASLEHLNELEAPDFKITNDPRVTRLGRFTRKTSLDELPQLFNVLAGHMSLVGPRPSAVSIDDYCHWHSERLEVRPGLTGPWQVAARADVNFDDRSRLDIAYVRRRSIALDLEIMARTLRVLAKPSGR